MPDQRMARRVVVVLCALSGVAVAASVPLLVLTRATEVPGAELPWFTTFAMAAPVGAWFTAIGGFVAWQRARHAVGWLLLATGVVTALSAPTKAYALYGLYTDPGSLPAAQAAAWFGQHVADVNLPLFALVFLLLPDGRLPSPRWRPVVWLVVAGAVVGLLAAFRPGRTLEAFPLLENPLGVGGPVGAVLEGAEVLLGPLLPLSMVAGLVALLARFRRGDVETRAQLKWVAYGVGLVTVSLVALLVSVAVSGQDFPQLSLMVFLVAIAALPGFIAIAVVRHRLFDIDVLIRRSLIYGAVSALIVAAWIGLATVLGVAVAGTGPAVFGVLVAVVVVLALQPVRRRVDSYAVRRVYGRSVSGPELLAQVGDLLEHSLDPEQLTQRLSDVLRDGLGLDWVRIRTPGGPSQGDPPDLTVPLTWAGGTVGVLEAGYRPDAELTAADRAVVERLAGQVALAVRNAQQAAALSESRARIVRAQAAERRRLGRNIHDGIQQQLVALSARLRLARNQLTRDPALADATLEAVQTDVRRAVEDLRELSRGIHPSVLSDRGLLEAVESLLTFVPLPVRLVADPGMRGRRWPEPVEEAGYFVVSEALANVLKHAEASAVKVSLGVDGDALVVQVDDDGVGLPAVGTNGSGLAGLRDRLDVVGGTLDVDGSPGSGTRLLARLPVRKGEPL